MNNTFSFYRLKLLFQKDWAENRNIYLLSTPAIAVIITLLYLLIGDYKEDLRIALMYAKRGLPDQYEMVYQRTRYKNEAIYSIGLFVTFSLNAILRVNKLANKKTLVEFLLLPSSAAEKLALHWIWSFPVLFVVYTSVFQMIDHGFITHYLERAEEAKAFYLAKSLSYLNLTHCLKKNEEFFGWLLVIYSSFLIWPFAFKKYAIIKGLITIPVIGFMLYTFSFHLMQRAFPYLKSVSLSGLYFSVSGFELSQNQKLFMGTLLFGLVPILIWIVNWYKIKEKQV
ncbi:hypothetical protein [Solitalea koreensis]|uniref:ABC-2 family transporter protein n=1 Tax=Solitalea koreensis TaxID=543615 RepID=A0A521AFF8_9SPHI|nr:hypothetical protein [Solitalea koreensis]SMO33527.1 hypothetical protein SAMN06265350_101105 [Solitalea koreensis]